ncbi:MAG: hypothetical protein FWD29_00525 [Micrococcales bacterium]|nr:hypothetical protein [Micrococcales bacterium]
MTNQRWLWLIIRCPNCQGELSDAGPQVICSSCRLAYPVEDGVPGLLAHRAVPHAMSPL